MLKIDELNNLEYDDEEVVQKLEKYFDAMDDITPQELDDRVSLGKDIFDLMMLFMFMVAGTNATGGYQDIEYYINMIQTSYATLITRFGVDDYLDDYVKRFSTEVVNTTFDNIDDEYYTSADRALFIAENEPNTVLNYDRYRNALEQGKTHKKWLTERDSRVRETHREVESVTIPIMELFEVGDSLMRFPHDTEYGAHPKEYIHCRCNVEYLPNSKGLGAINLEDFKDNNSYRIPYKEQVNPNYNPEIEEWANNCPSSVIATEMRFRNINNAMALPTSQIDTIKNMEEYATLWVGAKASEISLSEIPFLTKGRYAFSINDTTDTGHVTILSINENGAMIIDSARNMMYNSVERYVRKIVTPKEPRIYKVFRIDNKELTEKGKRYYITK